MNSNSLKRHQKGVEVSSTPNSFDAEVELDREQVEGIESPIPCDSPNAGESISSILDVISPEQFDFLVDYISHKLHEEYEKGFKQGFKMGYREGWAVGASTQVFEAQSLQATPSAGMGH